MPQLLLPLLLHLSLVVIVLLYLLPLLLFRMLLPEHEPFHPLQSLLYPTFELPSDSSLKRLATLRHFLCKSGIKSEAAILNAIAPEDFNRFCIEGVTVWRGA